MHPITSHRDKYLFDTLEILKALLVLYWIGKQVMIRIINLNTIYNWVCLRKFVTWKVCCWKTFVDFVFKHRSL